MATHSSVLAWRIPGTGEPHGLLSMGSQKVGQDKRLGSIATQSLTKKSYVTKGMWKKNYPLLLLECPGHLISLPKN